MIELRPSAYRFPADAFFSSFLMHMAAVLWFAWVLPMLPYAFAQPVVVEMANPKLKHSEFVLTLPRLQPRTQRSSSSASRPKLVRDSSPEAPSIPKAKVIFPGPQVIVSLPPRPDNLVQTIRQPDLPKAPKLKMPVALPNMLQLAAGAPVLAPQPQIVELNTKARRGERIPVRTRPEAAPTAKLNMPVAGDSSKSIAALTNTDGAAPRLAAAPKMSSTGSGGADSRNLVVLNAIPAPQPAEVPPGELSGSFVVAPDPTAGEGNGGAVTVHGNGANAGGHDIAGEKSGTKTAAGAGTGTGTGKSTGSGNGIGATGNGSGKGAGDNEGRNTIAGEGNGPFTGIGIEGPPPPAKTAATAPRSAIPRGTYGMTIVSTSSGGGGLRDYGVFKQETVYTVYIDMAESGRTRPSWTLQYAAVATPGSPQNSVLVPPFPSAKEYPQLPREVAAKSLGRMMVVAGVITAEGKFDALRVVQSPNPLLIKPLLDCLAKWTFQAAELNGAGVAVKFVLGIPITEDFAPAN